MAICCASEGGRPCASCLTSFRAWIFGAPCELRNSLAAGCRSFLQSHAHGSAEVARSRHKTKPFLVNWFKPAQDCMRNVALHAMGAACGIQMRRLVHLIFGIFHATDTIASSFCDGWQELDASMGWSDQSGGYRSVMGLCLCRREIMLKGGGLMKLAKRVVCSPIAADPRSLRNSNQPSK